MPELILVVHIDVEFKVSVTSMLIVLLVSGRMVACVAPEGAVPIVLLHLRVSPPSKIFDETKWAIKIFPSLFLKHSDCQPLDSMSQRNLVLERTQIMDVDVRARAEKSVPQDLEIGRTFFNF